MRNCVVFGQGTQRKVAHFNIHTKRFLIQYVIFFLYLEYEYQHKLTNVHKKCALSLLHKLRYLNGRNFSKAKLSHFQMSRVQGGWASSTKKVAKKPVDKISQNQGYNVVYQENNEVRNHVRN